MYVGTLISRYYLMLHDTNAGAAFTVLSSFVLICGALACYLLFRYMFGVRKV